MPFGHAQTARVLGGFGAVSLRSRNGAPVLTDAGNFVYDIKVAPIDDVAALDAALHRIAGVVETGLFVGRADVVVVASESGVRRLRRPA